MRKLIYILLAAAFISSSCHKEPVDVDNELPTFLGYMQFSTQVSTRGHLAETMRGKNFGVIGFRYSETSDWGTSKSTASPGTWFYNQKVECDDYGVCTYDPVQQWGNYNYTFFAYHPHNGAGISLSNSSTVDTPMLTYQYSWLNQTGNISLYDSNSPSFDLMTAEDVDVDGTGSGTVSFEFNHRLFAFEVLANNYNENTYEYELDANGDPVLDEDGNKVFKLDANGNKIIVDDAGQNISGLTLTLDGLTNTQMEIPLSMLSDEENAKIKYTKGDVGTRTFKLSDETLRIPAFNETISRTYNGEEEVCGAGVATSISKYGSSNGGYLFLIPQEGSTEGVTGTLNWTELSYFVEKGGEVSNEFTSTITFYPGVLYQIHINFVGDGITIALIEAGAWDSSPEVTHSFE